MGNCVIRLKTDNGISNVRRNFFLHYGKDGCNRHVLIDECRELFGEIYEQIPELPFCNIWTAMQLSSRLPKGALFHMGVSIPGVVGICSSCRKVLSLLVM